MYDQGQSRGTLRPLSRTSGRESPSPAKGGRRGRRSRRLGCLLAPALLSLCLVAAVAGYVFFALKRPIPSIPTVSILQPSRGQRLPAGGLVVFSAGASDPDGIVEVEFWVNGEHIGTQVNPAPQDDEPFVATQAWRPKARGSFVLFVRARDAKGYLGQSQPLVFEAVAPENKEQAGVKQYFPSEGETVEEIAAHFGTTPQDVRTLNPELEGRDPAPGESVLIPPVSEEEGPEEEPAAPDVEPAPGGPPLSGEEGAGPGGAPSGEPLPGETGEGPGSAPGEAGGGPGGAPGGETPPGEAGEAPGGAPGEAGGGSPGGAPGGEPPGEAGEAPGAPEEPAEPLPPSDEGRGPIGWLGDRLDDLFDDSNVRCRLLPGTCDDPAGIWRWFGGSDPWWWAMTDRPPEHPDAGPRPRFTAGKCSAEVAWRDTSDNEDGFYLFRRNLAVTREEPFVEEISGERVSPIATVEAHEGTGWVSFVDRSITEEGYYQYYVAAFNRSGMSAPVPLGSGFVPCPPPSEATTAPASYYLRMWVLTPSPIPDGGIRDLYCYLSAANLPYERFPLGDFLFLPSDYPPGRREDGLVPWLTEPRPAGAWYLYPAISTSLALREEPLPVRAECLGWRGGELVELGQAEGAIPVGSEDVVRVRGQIVAHTGAFVLEYRLERDFSSVPAFNPEVPPPTDLRLVNCKETPDDPACDRLRDFAGMVLVWRWPAPPELVPDAPRFFVEQDLVTGEYGQVESRYVWGRYRDRAISTPPIVRVGRDTYAYPLAECITGDMAYSVSALDARGFVSPFSEPLFVEPRGCPAIEITLEELRVHWVDDGRSGFLGMGGRDRTMEAYGYFWLHYYLPNGRDWTFFEIHWNKHSRPDLADGEDVPDTTAIVARDEPYRWSDFYLGWRGDPGILAEPVGRARGWNLRSFGTNQNTFRIHIPRGDVLFSVHLEDHDGVSRDDVWCSPWWATLPGDRSVEEWLRTDEVFTLHDEKEGQGECTVTIRVRGVMAGADD